MHHRFPKMLLNGEPFLVDVIRSKKEKADLAPGDEVEYRPARKLANIWHKARVKSVSLPVAIRLANMCRCGADGEPRVDNGLPAGFHCDGCWEDLVADCRKRSW